MIHTMFIIIFHQYCIKTMLSVAYPDIQASSQFRWSFVVVSLSSWPTTINPLQKKLMIVQRNKSIMRKGQKIRFESQLQQTKMTLPATVNPTHCHHHHITISACYILYSCFMASRLAQIQLYWQGKVKYFNWR